MIYTIRFYYLNEAACRPALLAVDDVNPIFTLNGENIKGTNNGLEYIIQADNCITDLVDLSICAKYNGTGTGAFSGVFSDALSVSYNGPLDWLAGNFEKYKDPIIYDKVVGLYGYDQVIDVFFVDQYPGFDFWMEGYKPEIISTFHLCKHPYVQAYRASVTVAHRNPEVSFEFFHGKVYKGYPQELFDFCREGDSIALQAKHLAVREFSGPGCGCGDFSYEEECYPAYATAIKDFPKPRVKPRGTLHVGSLSEESYVLHKGDNTARYRLALPEKDILVDGVLQPVFHTVEVTWTLLNYKHEIYATYRELKDYAQFVFSNFDFRIPDKGDYYVQVDVVLFDICGKVVIKEGLYRSIKGVNFFSISRDLCTYSITSYSNEPFTVVVGSQSSVVLPNTRLDLNLEDGVHVITIKRGTEEFAHQVLSICHVTACINENLSSRLCDNPCKINNNEILLLYYLLLTEYDKHLKVLHTPEITIDDLGTIRITDLIERLHAYCEECTECAKKEC